MSLIEKIVVILALVSCVSIAKGDSIFEGLSTTQEQYNNSVYFSRNVLPQSCERFAGNAASAAYFYIHNKSPEEIKNSLMYFIKTERISPPEQHRMEVAFLFTMALKPSTVQQAYNTSLGACLPQRGQTIAPGDDNYILYRQKII